MMLTYEEFISSCLLFYKKSTELQDGWECCGDKNVIGQFYLKKKCNIDNEAFEQSSLPPVSKCGHTCTSNTSPYELDKWPCGKYECRGNLISDCENQSDYELLEENENLYDELHDQSTISDYLYKAFITFEYHIVFSISHSVPVLYFNAWHMNGKMLILEEIWDNLNSSHKSEIVEKKWESLTQTEHPILGRPFFQLHPCKTADLMNKVLGPNFSVDDYIISWLSMFGNTIGLSLQNQYFIDRG